MYVVSAGTIVSPLMSSVLHPFNGIRLCGSSPRLIAHYHSLVAQKRPRYLAGGKWSLKDFSDGLPGLAPAAAVVVQGVAHAVGC